MQQLFQLRQNGPQDQNARTVGSSIEPRTLHFQRKHQRRGGLRLHNRCQEADLGNYFSYDDYKEPEPVVIIEKNLASDNDLKGKGAR